MNKILSWLAIAATVALLMYVKHLHIGVTHYNIFLLILIGWSAFLIVWFRWLGADNRKETEL